MNASGQSNFVSNNMMSTHSFDQTVKDGYLAAS